MRHGDLGSAVAALQRQLNAAGFKIDANGIYDDATEAAVGKFQKRAGLIADGIAGAKTLSALTGGARNPRLLSEADLVQAADRLGVPLAAIKAVNQVESRGRGFLDDGRRPVILYERHVMFQRLEAIGLDAPALAGKYPNLVSAQRGGYAGGASEYARLLSARTIDSGCALESCSWGQFQIMGYHWQALGYAGIDAFVTAMVTNEAAQLDAFVRFIEADPALLKALKSRKWADFARGYNGPAYKANLYDVKLARAFDRFAAGDEVPA